MGSSKSAAPPPSNEGPPSTPLPQWLANAPPAPGSSTSTPPRQPGEPQGVLSTVPLVTVEKLLQSHPALHACGRAELSEIAVFVRPFECSIGTVLLDATQPLCGIGLLVSGSAHAMPLHGDTNTHVEPMVAPDVFGESLALGSDRATYNVVAGSACRVLWIPSEAVYRLLDRAPGLPPVFAQRHAHRQERLQRGPTGTPSSASMPAVGATTPSSASMPAVGATTPSSASMPAVGAPPKGAKLDPFGHPEPDAPQTPARGAPPSTPSDGFSVSPPYDFAPQNKPRTTLPPLDAIPVASPSGEATPGAVANIHALPTLASAPVTTGPTPIGTMAPHLVQTAPPHGAQTSAASAALHSLLPPHSPHHAAPPDAAPTPSTPHMAAVGAPSPPRGFLGPLGAPLRPLASAAAPPPVPAVPPGSPAGPAAAPPAAQTMSPDVLRFVEVSDYDLGPSVLGLVPAKTIRQHRLLPLKVTGTRLLVGLVAPRNAAALAELARSVQGMFEIDVVAISADDYSQAIVRHRLEDPRTSSTDAKRAVTNPDTLVFEQSETEREPPTKSMGDEAVRLVNRIIATALDRDASDIHLEPMSAGIRVRFRVNGLLQDWNEAVPPQIARGVIARAKIMAGLDITERRRPQDGRIGVRAGRRDIDLRVSCLPAARGEKVVLRVLDSSMATRPLGQVFLDPRTLGMVRRALNRPYGGIIVGGATGAGKTSTLYAMLNERRQTRPDTHVTMVEDPIEYRLEGVTQVQVDLSADLGFAHVLRSMLRQDPDVIVVGEMRDSETARTALEAAMTGHVLLTSVHANNALSVVQRLEQLECGRPLISLSVSLVLVQRLVRRLCSGCHKSVEAPQALIDTLVQRFVLEPNAPHALPSPGGCDACQKTGFVGRIAVFESLQLTDEVRQMLATGAPFAEVEKLAIETGALVRFASYARHLLREQLISAGEALLTVAE
jgi:type IV pilus assembly protein PilB